MKHQCNHPPTRPVFSEIDVSAVFPFPDSALEPLADAIVARLDRAVGIAE